MDEALLGPRIGRWCIPCHWQIVGKLKKTRAIDFWARRRHGGQLLDSSLKLSNVLQCGIPARLQLPSDMALLRVHQFVSTSGQRCFIAGHFKFSLDSGDDVFPRRLDLIRSKDRGFDSAIGDCFQNLQSNRTIDPYTSDADAQSHTHVSIIATALIAMSIALPHAVEDTHHSSTPPAPHQPGEQRAPATRRFACTVLLHMRILKKELLVILVLLPADVARMIIAQQDAPFLSGLGAGPAPAPPVKTPRRACPRHECSRLGWISYRRATSATFASGASVSSTRRSFSALVQRRRRSGPERTVAVI